MLNRESLALNAGTDYSPEGVGYGAGDYVIVIDKNHPFYGQAAKIIGVQRSIYDVLRVPGSPDFHSENLHILIVDQCRDRNRTEVIIQRDKVKKIEK